MRKSNLRQAKSWEKVVHSASLIAQNLPRYWYILLLLCTKLQIYVFDRFPNRYWICFKFKIIWVWISSKIRNLMTIFAGWKIYVYCDSPISSFCQWHEEHLGFLEVHWLSQKFFLLMIFFTLTIVMGLGKWIPSNLGSKMLPQPMAHYPPIYEISCLLYLIIRLWKFMRTLFQDDASISDSIIPTIGITIPAVEWVSLLKALIPHSIILIIDTMSWRISTPKGVIYSGLL